MSAWVIIVWRDWWNLALSVTVLVLLFVQSRRLWRRVAVWRTRRLLARLPGITMSSGVPLVLDQPFDRIASLDGTIRLWSSGAPSQVARKAEGATAKDSALGEKS